MTDPLRFDGIEVEGWVTPYAAPDTIYVQQQDQPTRKWIVISARKLGKMQLIHAVSKFLEKRATGTTPERTP